MLAMLEKDHSSLGFPQDTCLIPCPQVPICHNFWGCVLEPKSHNYWAHIQWEARILQLEKRPQELQLQSLHIATTEAQVP